MVFACVIIPQHDGDATIMIIRNPIDAIVSYWKWNLLSHKIYRGKEDSEHVGNLPVTFFRECLHLKGL